MATEILDFTRARLEKLKLDEAAQLQYRWKDPLQTVERGDKVLLRALCQPLWHWVTIPEEGQIEDIAWRSLGKGLKDTLMYRGTCFRIEEIRKQTA